MKKVLLIEDNQYTKKLYEEKLTSEGFEVVSSINAENGLVLAKDESPDIILLDIMLPGGMNGFDVLEQLKKDERLSNIPVIVITNLDSEEKVAKDIGVTDYVVKANIELNDLIEKIKKYT